MVNLIIKTTINTIVVSKSAISWSLNAVSLHIVIIHLSLPLLQVSPYKRAGWVLILIQYNYLLIWIRTKQIEPKESLTTSCKGGWNLEYNYFFHYINGYVWCTYVCSCALALVKPSVERMCVLLLMYKYKCNCVIERIIEMIVWLRRCR